MGRFALMLTIITTILIVFHLGGILSNTPISWLISFIVKPQNYGNFELYQQITSAIALASGAGIIAGSIIQQRAEILMIGAVATACFFILGDFVGLFLILAEVHVALALLIIAPVTLIFMFTIVTWWRGVEG